VLSNNRHSKILAPQDTPSLCLSSLECTIYDGAVLIILTFLFLSLEMHLTGILDAVFIFSIKKETEILKIKSISF
jgi:hypothetical protein